MINNTSTNELFLH